MHLSFYEQLNMHAQLSQAWKNVYNLGPGLTTNYTARNI